MVMFMWEGDDDTGFEKSSFDFANVDSADTTDHVYVQKWKFKGITLRSIWLINGVEGKVPCTIACWLITLSFYLSTILKWG